MTRHSFRSPSLLQNLMPFVQPAAFSALFAVAGAGLACGSGSDVNTPASGGQKPAAGGSATTSGGSSAGGAGPGTGGTTANGGTLGGVAGSATGGTAPIAGSGGSGIAGGVGVAGSGAGGAGGATSGAGGGSSSGGTGAGGGGATHWVGTWTASPYETADNGKPPLPLANAVARQVTHASLGGGRIRVQFTNKLGTTPLVIKAAHVALCKAMPLVDGSIDTATDKALAFSGMPGVSIPAGAELWSDALDFALPALGNVSITTAFGSVPSEITSHNGARTDSYVKAASTDVSVANLTSADHNQHWWFITGMDVMAPAAAKGIVAIGDSVTDGRGVDPNANNRWTDILAARLQANAATVNVSIMNQGIGATNLIGSANNAAQGRFARDVLAQSGVKYVIIYDGVNDIGGGAMTPALKSAYQAMISAAHDKGLLVYGGTIMPFNGYSYYSVDHEKTRQEINTFIRSGAFDGVLDFDAALTDGMTPPSLQAAFAQWAEKDGLHPGPVGYKKMGDSIDLTLFTK